MGVVIEINGSQFFEHVRARAIYLPNESFGEKKSGLFLVFFFETVLPRTDFNVISMTGIPYAPRVIEKGKKCRSE